MRDLVGTRRARQQADIFRDLWIVGGRALGVMSWVLVSVSILCAAPAAASDDFDIATRDVRAEAGDDGYGVRGETLVLKLDTVTAPDRALNPRPEDAESFDSIHRQDRYYGSTLTYPDGAVGKGSSEFFRELRQIGTGGAVKVVFGLGEVKARWRF